MRTLPTIAIAALLGAEVVAHGAPYGEPAYVPAQKMIAGFQSEWLPVGGFYYAGPEGESSTPAASAWGFSGWVGWEVLDRLELGALVRYVAREQPAQTPLVGSEVDLAPRIAVHSRPLDQLDLWFSIAPGWSHVALPSGPPYPYGDPSGFVLDLGGGVSYPLAGRLLGVGTIGYQRGFQRTSEPGFGPMPAADRVELTTDYFHVGVGMAYRF